MRSDQLIKIARADDHKIFREGLSSLLKEFKNIRIVGLVANGEEVLKLLEKETVDVVISDINMPKLNGMELREKIHNNEDLRLKSIPYLFFSTSSEQQFIIDAYSKSVQGFFIKPSNYADLRKMLKTIIEYWNTCVSPNYVK